MGRTPTPAASISRRRCWGGRHTRPLRAQWRSPAASAGGGAGGDATSDRLELSGDHLQRGQDPHAGRQHQQAAVLGGTPHNTTQSSVEITCSVGRTPTPAASISRRRCWGGRHMRPLRAQWRSPAAWAGPPRRPPASAGGGAGGGRHTTPLRAQWRSPAAWAGPPRRPPASAGGGAGGDATRDRLELSGDHLQRGQDPHAGRQHQQAAVLGGGRHMRLFRAQPACRTLILVREFSQLPC